METKIRQLRQEKGITQQALADSSGVTRQTINALENARYNKHVQAPAAVGNRGPGDGDAFSEALVNEDVQGGSHGRGHYILKILIKFRVKTIIIPITIMKITKSVKIPVIKIKPKKKR